MKPGRRARANRTRKASGKPTGWFEAAGNLTGWKWAEAETRAIMELVPAAVFVGRGPRCLEITGNRMAYEMLRLPQGRNLSKAAPANRGSAPCRAMKNGMEVPRRELPLEKAAATGETIHDVDLELVFRDGTRRFVVGNAAPIPGGNGKPRGAIGTFLDVTALKQAEERFRVFVENAPVAIFMQDPQGRIAVANAQAERLFGYSRNEMVGQRVEMLIPERMRRKHVQQRNAYMGVLGVRPMGVGLELAALHKDGHEIPVEISLNPMKTTSGTFVAGTVLDLSDRKRFEKQSRVTTILLERARVARELHDTLTQGFVAIILNLEAVQAAETFADLPGETRALLKRAANLAREYLGEVRHFIGELSAPPSKRSAGLVGPLRRLAGRALPGEKTRVKFSLGGTPRRLGLLVEQNLLFIARQAIDNALLHAGANEIRVGLRFGAKDVRIRVQDDGRGFNVKRSNPGFGLTSMRGRANYIGAQFKLNSRPGKGTVVEVKFPFAELNPYGPSLGKKARPSS